jgi:hypothetical protein
MDLHIGSIDSINSTALKLYVTRGELEPKFQLVIFPENRSTRVDPKSSAK